MNNVNWIQQENFDDTFILVHGAFIGWITNSMLAVYIGQLKNEELELIIFFRQQPSKMEMAIIDDEILFSISDSLIDVGIKNLNYRPLILSGSIGEFKANDNQWLMKFWPIFQKYEMQEYDM